MNKLNKLKIGYFLVYKSQDKFVHKLIEKQQLKEGFDKYNAKYIHVEPSLGGKWGINAKFPQVVITDITKAHKSQYIKLVKPLLPKYEQHRKNVAIHCMTRINLPYGIFGVAWFKVKKYFKDNYFAFFGDFCSELCGLGLWSEYCKKLEFDINKVLPADFDKLYPAHFLNKDYFEIVWEGNVNDIC